MNLVHIRTAIVALGFIAFGLSKFAVAQASLENPQPASYQSGIGLLSGWSCSPGVSIDIDGTIYSPAYGTSRADAASVCGGNPNVGYGLLFNFNTLGPGRHTAQLRVNGALVGAPATFTVTVPVGEFATGLAKTVTVADFPTTGKSTQLIWQQAQQNFAISSVTGASSATCTRAIYLGPTNSGTTRYYINTYTQNEIEVGGVKNAKGDGWQFTAAWSSAPLNQNPFLVGRNTAGLAAATYGVVGSTDPAYAGFNRGDVIRVAGNAASGFSLTDIVTSSTVFFAPSGVSASTLPCTSASGTYNGTQNSGTVRYTVSIFATGSGAITGVAGNGWAFSSSWTNWIGSTGVVDPAYSGFTNGGKIGVLDIGENGLAIYTLDQATSKVGVVTVFLQED